MNNTFKFFSQIVCGDFKFEPQLFQFRYTIIENKMNLISFVFQSIIQCFSITAVKYRLVLLINRRNFSLNQSPFPSVQFQYSQAPAQSLNGIASLVCSISRRVIIFNSKIILKIPSNFLVKSVIVILMFANTNRLIVLQFPNHLRLLNFTFQFLFQIFFSNLQFFFFLTYSLKIRFTL